MDFYFQRINEYRNIARKSCNSSGTLSSKLEIEEQLDLLISGLEEIKKSLDNPASINDFYDRSEEYHTAGLSLPFKRAFDDCLTSTTEATFARFLMNVLAVGGNMRIDLDWFLAAIFQYNRLPDVPEV